MKNGIPSDPLKQLVQEQFGATAASFVLSQMHRGGNDLERLVKCAQLNGTENVLDVATGGGHTALAFSKQARSVVALDFTAPMLEEARRFVAAQGQYPIRFVRGDAECLPFATNTFDIVTARLAPHHFPTPARFVAEVARTLKVNGRFLLSDNMGPQDDELDAFLDRVERWRDPSHIRAWRLSVWRVLCEQSGLQVEFAGPLEKKTYPFDEWTDRMRLAADQKIALAEWIQTAPPHVQEFFEVCIDNGKLVSLCATFGILGATKTAKTAAF